VWRYLEPIEVGLTLLKAFAESFFLPLPLCLILLLAGLLLLWFTKRQKAGKILVSAGVFILIIATCGPASDVLLNELEEEYSPIATSELPGSSPRWIIVLGGGHTIDPRLPATSQLAESSLARLVEGIRLQRLFPDSKLLLSGGPGEAAEPVAQTMSRAAQALGVAASDIVLEDVSKNTAEEAALVAPMIGQERFLLVTSAAHMPRAVALFRKKGLDPIPSPSDYGVKVEAGRSSFGLYPRSGRLNQADIAMHEYVGMKWAKLRGEL
jgi:uncharacterized SAM-binding protein YcdF (DUF218 family)